jgi:hypothetical protein
MRLIHWPDGMSDGHDGAIDLLHDGDVVDVVKGR